MKLGEAEAFRVLNHHDGGVGDIDADFNHGGGNQHLDFTGRKPSHQGLLFLGGEAAVHEPDGIFGENPFLEPPGVGSGVLQVEFFRFFNEGIDDIDLPSLFDLFPQVPVEGFPQPSRHTLGSDRFPPGWQLVDDGQIHVAVQGHGEGAGDGGGGHHEDIGRRALADKFQALADPEPVLLVDDDETQVSKGDLFLKKGVGSDDEPGLSRLDGLVESRFLRGAQGPRQEDGDGTFKDGKVLECVKVLSRENLRGGHEGNLEPVVQKKGGGDGGDNRFATAHVALEEAVHWPFGGDVPENLPYGAGLRLRERERKPVEDRAQLFTGGGTGYALRGCPVLFLPGEEELEEEIGFVEETLAGHFQVRGEAKRRVGGVQCRESVPERGEMISLPDGRGKGVFQIGRGPFHGLPREFQERLLADVPHLRVDGKQGAKAFRRPGTGRLFHVGMVHFQQEAEPSDVPADVVGFPRLQLFFEIGDPLEPLEGQGARAVPHLRLQIGMLSEPLGREPDDFGNDVGALSRREVPNGDFPTAIFVTIGESVEEVSQSRAPHLFERFQAGRPDPLEARDGDIQNLNHIPYFGFVWKLSRP